MPSPHNQPHGYSVKSIRNGLIAGYAAGTCGIIVGHPLDSIKVLLQTNGGQLSNRSVSITTSGGQSPHSSSMANASNPDRVIKRATSLSTSSATTSNVTGSTSGRVKMSTVAGNHSAVSPPGDSSIVGKRSLRALYAGVTGPLLTAGLLRSLDFAIYDSIRRTLYHRQLISAKSDGFVENFQHDDYLHYDNLSNIAAASFLTGSITSAVTSPLTVIKTKQQIMVWGFRKAASETYLSGSENGKQNFFRGMRQFYTGFGLHFLCFTLGGSVYFTAYEMSKRYFAQKRCGYQELDLFNNKVRTSNLSLGERMISAAAAGTSCWCVIFPADVVRSRLYAQSLSHHSTSEHVSGFKIAKRLIQEGSLYKGMGVTVLRAGPVAAAVLPVYDSVLSWLNA
mmetsp:Transcript_24473/g.48660  ORF Transcript_24473/g.48660 Transcript_24473/m.48660 type:complete len:394 (+) Transcript_24473:136-1317(+)